MKTLFSAIIIAVISLALIAISTNALIKHAVSDYEKPDTTIVTKNGKSDTIIVKKQALSIFK